jgi:hypothetical protein
VSADKTCSDCKRLAANARDFAKSLVVRNHISVAEQKTAHCTRRGTFLWQNNIINIINFCICNIQWHSGVLQND